MRTNQLVNVAAYVQIDKLLPMNGIQIKEKKNCSIFPRLPFEHVNTIINVSLRWNATNSRSAAAQREYNKELLWRRIDDSNERANEGGFIALVIVYLVMLGKRITGNTMRTVNSRQTDLLQCSQIQLHGIRLIVADWNGTVDSNCSIASNLSTQISWVQKRELERIEKKRKKYYIIEM